METITNGVLRHQAWVGQLLNDDRISAESTCDLVLESEGKQFRVHKSVVMLVSNFFRRMFTVEMKEKYEGTVKMQQIPHQRLANIIEFIYCGQIEITEENILDILDDAEYTEIQVLKAKCNAFLLQVVSADNCLKLRAYAQRYNLGDLVDKTNQTIAKNLESVIQHDDFKQLDVDNVCAILKQRNKNCEEAVFSGIVQWVNHNPLQREKFFVDLFPLLDLASMSVDFLNEVYEENMVKKSLVCINLFAQASLKMNKRAQNPKFLVIGGEDSEQDCVVYDVKTKQAKQFPKLNVGRCGATSVKSGSAVYVIGGAETYTGHNPLKSCEMLDINKRTSWMVLPDMLEARDDCRSGLIQEQIFVTGGYNNGKKLSSCEKFNIYNNKWIRIKDMLHARANHGTVVCHDSLYCIGGWDDSKPLALCEHYDIRSGKWNKIAPLNQARWGLASVVLDGDIYAIGGCCDNNLSTVEQYKPEINRWKKVASIEVARRRLSACVIGNKIFVVGGGNGKWNKLNLVEVYNPTLDVWTNAFETDAPVYGATVVAF